MRRRIVMALVMGLGWLAATGVARAATYTVYGCDGNHGDSARDWVPFNDNGGNLKSLLACPQIGPYHGLRQRTGDATGRTVPNGQGAGFRFTAPVGLTIVGLSQQFDVAYSSSGFKSMIQSDVGKLAGCDTEGCYRAGESPSGELIANARWIETSVRCARAPSCTVDSGASFPTAELNVGLVNVLMSDVNPPVIGNVHGGLWESPGWVRGPQQVGFDAGDASGVSAQSVLIDETNATTHEELCDYTRVVPCPSSASENAVVDTANLADGAHRVRVAASDATKALSNLRVLGSTVNVDNHAPAAPTNLAVTGGEGWRASNAFQVAWSNPSEAGVAPIVAAHYRVCSVADGQCQPEQRVAGSDLDHLDGVAVPAPGDYTLKVWLEDAAGNANDAAHLETADLRYDPSPPGRAAISAPAGWVNSDGARSHPLALSLAPGEGTGPSGVGGYAVTFDGSDPGDRVTAIGAAPSVAVDNLPEGATTVKARAISSAGVPSSQMASATVRIDRHRPEVAADRTLDASNWTNGPVEFVVTGTDQEGLSGLDPAGGDGAAAGGGRIVYAVDDGPEHEVRGARASVAVGADGTHTVAFHATDAAGNDSAVHTVSFKVDGTPPGPVAFDPQDPEDPQQLNVGADDRTSGIAGGAIELRKLGHGPWRSLRSTYDGRELHARLDDGRLAPGIYALRARVQDVAGNVTTSEAASNGRLERLRLPLRLATRLAVAASLHRESVCRTARRRRRVTLHGRHSVRTVRVRECRRMNVPSRARRVVRSRYGRAVRLYGRLATDTGEGVAGERVVVDGRRRGRRSQRLTVRTDRFGRFSVRVPPGPSREVTVRFPGTSVLLGASARRSFQVPAHTTLGLSRTRLRVGQTLRFSGRLPGPVPKAGVVVQVQAVVRGRWQTFATPRTNASGRWAATYTFRATTGLVTYSFRAFVARAADYPYEDGASVVRHATVRG